MDNSDWISQAACAPDSVDPRLFHSSKPEDKQAAKDICAECPVRFLCLKDALDRKERFGIHGGVDQDELRKVLAIDAEGKPKVHTTGPIRCPFCGPWSTKHLEVVEWRRTKTLLHCTECSMEWWTRKIISRRSNNF